MILESYVSDLVEWLKFNWGFSQGVIDWGLKEDEELFFRTSFFHWERWRRWRKGVGKRWNGWKWIRLFQWLKWSAEKAEFLQHGLASKLQVSYFISSTYTHFRKNVCLCHSTLIFMITFNLFIFFFKLLLARMCSVGAVSRVLDVSMLHIGYLCPNSLPKWSASSLKSLFSWCDFNFRQSIDLYGSVPSPNIGFLGTSSLTGLGSSFLGSSLTRRHTAEIMPPLKKPLIQPIDEQQQKSSKTLIHPHPSRKSSMRKDPSKISHEVQIPSQCSFGQAVLNGKY